MIVDSLQVAASSGTQIPKEGYVAIGAILGAIVTAIAAFINASIQGANQVKLAKTNNDHTVQLEQMKLTDQRTRADRDLRRTHAEAAHEILTHVAMDNSLTVSFITETSGTTLPEYHQQYLRSANELGKLQMIAELYFPTLVEKAQAIAGQANIYWGNQQSLLWFATKGNTNQEQISREKVVTASLEIDTLVGQAKIVLRDIASDLNLPLEHRRQ